MLRNWDFVTMEEDTEYKQGWRLGFSGIPVMFYFSIYMMLIRWVCQKNEIHTFDVSSFLYIQVNFKNFKAVKDNYE